MSFLNPFLLIGLLAIAIPLLIHLINLRRPKKIRFSTLVFFDSLKANTLRRIKIKKWLLLLIRMAAILLLCFALARPFIPSEFGGVSDQGQPAAVGILIDNSPGMDQVDRNGPFLDQAKRIAEGIIENSKNEDRIILEVSHGPLLDLPALPRGGVLSQLNDIETVNRGNFLMENLDLLINRLNQTPQPVKRLYLITDGQATQYERKQEESLSEIAEEMAIHTYKVGEDVQPNVAITGMELQSDVISSDQPIQASVQVENYGNSAIQNHFLSLESGGEMAAQHRIDLEGGQRSTYEFEIIPSGDDFITGLFLLEGDELTFDNRYHFSIRIPDRRRIAVIREEPSAGVTFASYLTPVLDAALAANELLEVETFSWDEDFMGGGDPPDAIILDGIDRIPAHALDDLVSYIQIGGGLLFLPSAQGDLQSYNRFFERVNAGRFVNIEGSYGSFNTIDRLARLQDGHPILENLFDRTGDEEIRVNLPEIFYKLELELNGGSSSYRLLTSEQGSPILVERAFGEGLMMISSIGADPGWSNFPIKPVFAPLFYRSVLYLATSERGGLLQHQLGDSFEFQLPGSPEQIAIEVGEHEVVPERRSGFQGIEIRDEAKEWTPGFVTLVVDGNKIPVAVNQHTMESDLRALSNQELKDFLERQFRSATVNRIIGNESEIAEQMQAAGYGREIWFWFIIGAFILLLTESIVARLFKAESIS